MISREFVYQKGGWLLTTMPWFDPVTTANTHVLIHDILEHTPEDSFCIEDEFMALGATHFIRVNGKWVRYNSNYFGVQYFDLVHFINSCKNDLYKNTIAECDESFSNELDNFNFYCLNKNKSDMMEQALRWYSKGYERAKKRWYPHSSDQVMAFWDKLYQVFLPYGNAFKDMCDQDNIDKPYLKGGTHMRVNFDITSLTFSVQMKSPNEQRYKTIYRG